MAILIEGINMPENCFDCPFMYGRKYCLSNSKIEFNDPEYSELKRRHDDCPLVPVPEPHGRLIDESKISLAKYEQAAHDALHNGKGSILYDSGVLAGARAITQLVRRAPTVIPSSEEAE